MTSLLIIGVVALALAEIILLQFDFLNNSIPLLISSYLGLEVNSLNITILVFISVKLFNKLYFNLLPHTINTFSSFTIYFFKTDIKSSVFSIVCSL